MGSLLLSALAQQLATNRCQYQQIEKLYAFHILYMCKYILRGIGGQSLETWAVLYNELFYSSRVWPPGR